MRRREFLGTAAAGVAVLAGCGGGDSPSAPAGDGRAAGFPATVRHKHGTTTVDTAPERVVVVGLRELDALLALGTVPVAVTKWLPDAVHPWAAAELGGRPEPEVLTADDGIDVEAIAALRPDLVVAVYSNLTARDHATLSKLAPVIGQPVGTPDFGSSWQQETTMVGAALGKAAEAERLVGETEAAIAAARRDHPAFEGATAAMAMLYQGVFLYGAADARTRILEDLGFAFPDALADAFEGEFGGQLSDERLDELDLDAMVWLLNEPGTTGDVDRLPVYRDLAVRKEGRDVRYTLEEPGFYALPYQSVLSVPVLLEHLVPRLAAAVDGDPDTPTTAKDPG